MKQNPSSEANSHSASQEIRRLLWNPKVHYRVHNSPPLVPIVNQKNLVQTIPPYFSEIHSNIIFHLFLGLPRGLFPSGSPTKTLLCIPHLPHACFTRCPSYPPWLDLQ